MKIKPTFTLIKKLPLIALLFGVVLSTGCNEKDEDPGVRPVVISTDPVSDATDVVLNNQIKIVFSEEMNASTSSNFSLEQDNTLVVGTAAINGASLSFTASEDLLPNTLYTATMNRAAANLSGVTMQEDYEWSFTTGGLLDVIAPTVASSVPEASATGIAVNMAVAITFSESMDQSTINAMSYTVMDGSTQIEGAITTTETEAVFTPAVNLDNDTEYTVTITTDVKDRAGNALENDYILTFTTEMAPDVIPPMVNSTDPLNNAVDVDFEKVISITFSEEMDASTITSSTFTFKRGTTDVSGAINYSGNIATFTPNADLEAGLEYSVAITTGAKDLAGNALEANTEWSFTTGTNASGQAKVLLGGAKNYVILAKSAINNSPTSAITGDLGLSPAATSFITGFALTDATGYATSPQVTGKVYAADMASPTPTNLTTAVEDMITAYNDAAGRPTPDFLELGTGNIGGKTLSPGLYKWTTTVTLPTDVVISGTSNDVWIFQISGDLEMSSAVNITLTGGAQAKNIFWQVAGAAVIGTTAHFEGVILSMTGITFQTGATVNGRLLAQTAVILDANAVTQPQ